MKKQYVGTLCLILLSVVLIHAKAAGPQNVLPVKVEDGAVSLQGQWKFKYLPSSDIGGDDTFYQPAFDVSSWKTIPVPSHWELHGFAQPKYKKVDEGTGLYRHTFRIPVAWQGQRVFLRFDGVLYGLTAWVNGKEIGQWASSYNPVTFDITDTLLSGDVDNILAVRVTTRCKGWEFDTNDCWALSGIYREVTLFAVPATHLKDYTARTTLAADGSAQLFIEVQASAAAEVAGSLSDPDGRLVRQFQISLKDKNCGSTQFEVPKPRLWTAETPSLYRLEFALKTGGQVVQKFSDKIGLRQIAVADGILKLNGVPIKLRGINHHDIWPKEGRVATEELMRRDLELIRDANINFIRTSHYPPHPRFIELCDEMGFYVMCEVPFGKGDDHLTDTSYQDILFSRVAATVMRDKNRPSVIVWSIGNENQLTDLTINTARRTRELDPTRPVCFPTVGNYFNDNLQRYLDMPEFVEIFAPHYPSAESALEYAITLRRPIIFTEYAHALGLAADRIQSVWDVMQNNPRIAGGAIWMFQDQGILRTSDKPVDLSAPTFYVWEDTRNYYDTDDTDGADGIVYSDRTPQVDYWQVRKVYCPVQIKDNDCSVRPGPQEIVLHVENRHDFRDLSGVNLKWSLRVDGAVLQTGVQALHAKPRQQETVTIKINLPDNLAQSLCILETQCVNENGRELSVHHVRLNAQGVASFSERLLAALPESSPMKISEQGKVTRVVHERFTVCLGRDTGQIEIRNKDNQVLATCFYPHVGHRFTLSEELRNKTISIWKGSFLRNPQLQAAEVSQTAQGVRILVRGKYARNDDPNQFLNGEYSLMISSKGSIEVSYDYVQINAEGTFLETGLSMVMPQTASEFCWLGTGPYAGYPGKDKLNEFGSYHLNRRDIYFQGNRRQVELAVLCSPSGQGLLLAGAPMDIAVENTADGVIFSQNALISGRGSKRVNPEDSVEAKPGQHIMGKFTVVVLDSTWPALLTRWLPSPGNAVKPFQPFYHSYDQ